MTLIIDLNNLRRAGKDHFRHHVPARRLRVDRMGRLGAHEGLDEEDGQAVLRL